MVIRKIRNFSLSQIADSGQCFRMNRLDSGAYRVIAFGKYLESMDLGDGKFRFSCSEDEYQKVWSKYFDLHTDYQNIGSLIPPDDAFLTAAIRFGRGMRILRQDPWETTVSFIISQRKNIPAIKTAIENLCRNFGTPMECDGNQYFAFPSAEQIACLTTSDIARCSLGYRDKYVAAAAQKAAGGGINFSALLQADEETARTELKSFYGIGDKVANCILLFGLHKMNAFPEDTWINRIIASEYGGSFPRDRYAGYLGIIQQYMFYYGRSLEYLQAAPLNIVSNT